jgi:hypothetical protein
MDGRIEVAVMWHPKDHRWFAVKGIAAVGTVCALASGNGIAMVVVLVVYGVLALLQEIAWMKILPPDEYPDCDWD